MNAEPLQASDGSPEVAGAVASFTDVTEAHALAEQLALHRDRLEELVRARTRDVEAALAARHEAERFSRLVSDTIPGRVAYWDAARVCRFANRRFCEQIGRAHV